MLLNVPPINADTPALTMPYADMAPLNQTAESGDGQHPFAGEMSITGDALLGDWRPMALVTGSGELVAAAIPDADARPAAKADNDIRLSLLAKKYAESTFTVEDKARLSIVSERLRQAMPRVEIADVQAIEAATARLEQAESLRAKLKTKYGL